MNDILTQKYVRKMNLASFSGGELKMLVFGFKEIKK